MIALVRISKIAFVALFIVLAFVFVCSFFLVPLTDWDVALYYLIGKGLISKQILPYGYIFDHKPYLLYVFYYLWCESIPFSQGKFALLGLCSLVFIAWLSKKFFNVNGKLAFALLFLGGIPSDYMAGNSEVLQVPLVFLSVLLLLKGSETQRASFYVLSALFAVVAINVNYLTGFILLPLLFYAVFSSLCTKRGFFIYILTALSTFFIIILPFLWKGCGKAVEYFGMQYHYVHNYGADFSERLTTLKDLIVVLSILYPIILNLFNCRDVFFVSKKGRMLLLWSLVSFLAAVSSGHDYRHYWAFFVVPTMVLGSILFTKKSLNVFVMVLPLLCYDSLIMVDIIKDNVSQVRRIKRANISYLHKTIGEERVLGIHENHSIYYLANLETYDRFLFPGNIEVYFGKKAKEHYLADLAGHPSFVMTPYNACKNKEIYSEVCYSIDKNYNLIYQGYNYKKPKNNNQWYYDLYKLRDNSPR